MPAMPATLQRLWTHLRQLFAELGYWNGLLYLTGELLRRGSGGHIHLIRYAIVAQPVRPGRLSATGSTTLIRCVSADDPLVAAFPRPTAVIAQRYRSGSICFAAQVKQRFAGFLWLSFGQHDEDEVRCRYELVDAARCAWDFDVHVEPDFRMGRTFARLWDRANQHLNERGIAWSLSRISTFNPASLRAHARLGTLRLGTATFLRVGPGQLAIFDTPPFLHLSLHRGAIPRLRLRPPYQLSEG